jgi:hypothetical protein
MDEPKYSFKPTFQLAVLDLKPDYNLAFHNNGKEIGKLDFNGPALVFTGDAEESAKVFIDWVARSFAGRLEEERKAEREACALLVEENVQECNGPIGFVLQSNADAIRARGNTQPKALRLADELDGKVKTGYWEAAAELRRLHSVNDGLLEALTAIVNSAEANQAAILLPLIDDAREAIAKAHAPDCICWTPAQPAPTVQEPVATKLKTEQFNCFHVSAEDFQRLKALPVGAKLYTAAPTVQEPVQKRPPNCGTGYCSCIECVMEPAAHPAPIPDAITDNSESVEYKAGWNAYYRSEMLKGRMP